MFRHTILQLNPLFELKLWVQFWNPTFNPFWEKNIYQIKKAEKNAWIDLAWGLVILVIASAHIFLILGLKWSSVKYFGVSSNWFGLCSKCFGLLLWLFDIVSCIWWACYCSPFFLRCMPPHAYLRPPSCLCQLVNIKKTLMCFLHDLCRTGFYLYCQCFPLFSYLH